ncbi:hypothetical protein COLO4_03856 [Corchorus olitorius]|uniref:hAT-like transposase RNase-H fold domain-containing protein n=1 Tax=Corchorus olitorius TaxID=93759 RepID=A0A1R3KWA7_9ROSI|nr:hypothetical protein COLO4_03856 [Corchorus olitorius]
MKIIDIPESVDIMCDVESDENQTEAVDGLDVGHDGNTNEADNMVGPTIVWANKMKEKYNKYWCQVDKTNMLVYVAAVMDPRKKLFFVDLCIKKMYGCEQAAALLASINEALLNLFEDYRKRYTPSDKGSEPQKSSQNVAVEIDDDYAMDHEVDDSEGDAMAQFYKHQMESGTVQ